MQDVDVTRDFKTKNLIGTFTCSCGFIYARKQGTNIFKIGRVKAFGESWQQRLNELANENLSVRAVARELGVDSKTKLAFTNGNKINKEDIHVQQGEILSQEKVAFIDVFIEPTDINEDGIKEFNDSWFELIGDLRSEDLDMNQLMTIVSSKGNKGNCSRISTTESEYSVK
ncbi:TnsD family Tn7-like transposition protein [Lysinibacillus sp. NPDC093190]|uniref:TnsD family Tn7-like transposition protein n=1 Tax=unclassified Lysinibacillus TaxID=2636778 RepID=UPI00380B91A9